MGAFRLSLTFKISVLCVGVSAILAVALMYRAGVIASRGLAEQAEAALRSDAQLVTEAIDGWNEERTRELQAVGAIPSLVNTLQATAGRSAEDAREAQAILNGVGSMSKDVDSVALCDAAGDFVMSTNRVDIENKTNTVKQRDYFHRAMAGESFTTGVSKSTVTGEVAVFHSSPVRPSVNQQVVGIIRSRAGVSALVEAVNRAKDRVGEGALGVLLDQDGLVIAASGRPEWADRAVLPLSKEIHDKLIADKRWGKTAEPSPLNEKGLGPAVGVREPKGFSSVIAGAAYRGYALPLRATPWVYVALEPEATLGRAAEELKSSSALSILIGLLLTTVAAYLFTRTVIAPIRHLTDVTGRIVRDGDLSQRIESRSSDEVGQLARTFGQLVDKLREIPATLNESVGSLSRASDELSEAAREQSDVVLRQSAALQETQVTAQELKQTSMLAAQKAEDVLSVVQRADEAGQEGERAVEESLRTFAELNTSITEIAQRVQQLDLSARQIGDITASVKDLADQSNMLALNAAIEAVRAGEHGKGFGVVAREIRNLADQSIDATKRVREILQAVTEAINGLVRIAERGGKQMEGGLVQMKSSGEKLALLAGIVKENSNAARQIAGAVRQQSAAMAQIFSAVSSQMQMMDDTKKRLEGTTSAADQLKGISGKISAIVRSYRA